MAVANGHSNVKADIELMVCSLRQMINSIELYFCNSINSLNTRISDIEHDIISPEEKSSLCRSYYITLEEQEIKRFHARNKLVICIYSICEASLAEICHHYRIPLRFSPQNTSKRFYYLTDYLFTLGVDYSPNNQARASYIVSNAIRSLRNYLVHSKETVQLASDIVNGMLNVGFSGIEARMGSIQIMDQAILFEILNLCNEMLLESESIAREKHNIHNK